MKTKKMIMILAIVLVIILIGMLCVGYGKKIFGKKRKPDCYNGNRRVWNN
ncbi:MAG: hypothetical protein HFJ26_07020 [Clostridia bacterium]|nr:hypothetical protein [Clostridia bacterium]